MNRLKRVPGIWPKPKTLSKHVKSQILNSWSVDCTMWHSRTMRWNRWWARTRKAASPSISFNWVLVLSLSSRRIKSSWRNQQTQIFAFATCMGRPRVLVLLDQRPILGNRWWGLRTSWAHQAVTGTWPVSRPCRGLKRWPGPVQIHNCAPRVLPSSDWPLIWSTRQWIEHSSTGNYSAPPRTKTVLCSDVTLWHPNEMCKAVSTSSQK